MRNSQEMPKLIEATREFVPGVWITGYMLEDVPRDDPDYPKVAYLMAQAFDWKLPPPSKLVIADVLFPPKPYKVFRLQKRRWWQVTWTEGGYDEIVPQELPVMAFAGATVPVAGPAPEIRHVDRIHMAWTGWQYELEQTPEGFPEFAYEKGWLNA